MANFLGALPIILPAMASGAWIARLAYAVNVDGTAAEAASFTSLAVVFALLAFFNAARR